MSDIEETSQASSKEPAQPLGAAARVARAAAAARSGLRRYPRELVASMREAGLPRRLVNPLSDLSPLMTARLGAAWVGHATVLMRLGGQTILTDPVFSSRVGVSVGSVTFGLSRLLPPALDVEHLPQIDLVLLSHAHFDHLDKPSLRRLAAGPARGATVVTADRTRALIPEGFGEVIQLTWNRSVRVGELRIHALRPVHWGARTAIDRRRGFNAYLVEHGRDRVIFGGDTAYTDAFDRVGDVDLSILGIGAYQGWDGAHATPEQVWRMFTKHAGKPGSRLLPMHHSTFDMGEPHVREPLQRLVAAAGRQNDRIVCPQVGGVWIDPRPVAGGSEQGPEQLGRVVDEHIPQRPLPPLVERDLA